MSSPLTGYPSLTIESARTHHDAEGALALWVLSDRALIVSRARGKMTVPRARMIEDAAEEMARTAGRYTALHDWEELSDYEIEARLRLVAAGVRLRNRGNVHLLVRSRLIFAAVRAAQAILDNLRVHEARASFEAELVQRTHAARPPPPSPSSRGRS